MNSKTELLRFMVTAAMTGILLLATSFAAFAQWVNYPTAGIPRTSDGQPHLTAPTPRTADRQPDFCGVWIAEDQTYFMNLAAGLGPQDVVLQPWAAELQKQRVANQHGDDPLAKCLPHGVPRVNTNGIFPFKIIQTPGLIAILYE